MFKILGSIMVLGVIAAVCVVVFQAHPGDVVIHFASWQLHTTLWFLLVCGVFVFIILNSLWGLIRMIKRAPKRWRHKRSLTQSKRCGFLAQQALAAWLVGSTAQAAKLAQQATKLSSEKEDTSLLQVIKAWVAGQQGEWSQQRAYLAAIAPHAPKTWRWVQRLLEAQSFRDSGQEVRAQQAVATFPSAMTKLPEVIRLQVSLLQKQGDWAQVEEILSGVKCWDQLLDIRAVYSQALVAMGRTQKAARWLELQIKTPHENDSCLVLAYGYLQHTHWAHAIQVMQDWSRLRPNEGAVWYGLGRLCVQAQRDRQAQTYFEKSLLQVNDQTVQQGAHCGLAMLYLKQYAYETALMHLKKGGLYD